MTQQLAPGASVIVDAPEVVAVRHGREGAVQREHLEAVPWQVELADDLRSEERHHVRAHREFETREDFLGDGRAAQHMAPLEHHDAPASAGQVRRVCQSVVSAADNDCVVLH